VNKSSVNASPLIFFSRSHQLDLLRHFARQVFVPEPVAMEIRTKGPQDISVKGLEETPWLEVVSSKTVPVFIQEHVAGS